jgi:predicted nuclease of restriction endonuclease-like (RecB) superfamily
MKKETEKKQKGGSRREAGSRDIAPSSSLTNAPQDDFDSVLKLIETARTRAVAAVNTTLIELYWSIGEFIQRKIADDGWGKGTVEDLAEHIRRKQPNVRGFSARNLWRMMQFFETYRNQPNSQRWCENCPGATTWRSSAVQADEEREFYLRMATKERWSFRELQRQLSGALFERLFFRRQNCHTVGRIASGRCHHVQGQLPCRVSGPARCALRR